MCSAQLFDSPTSLPPSFWNRVTYERVGEAICWIWTGPIIAKQYGCWKGQPVHRWTYREAYGEIPAGLVLDHKCNNKRSVRPSHLEAVTQGENVRRAHREYFDRVIYPWSRLSA